MQIKNVTSTASEREYRFKEGMLLSRLPTIGDKLKANSICREVSDIAVENCAFVSRPNEISFRINGSDRPFRA